MNLTRNNYPSIFVGLLAIASSVNGQVMWSGSGFTGSDPYGHNWTFYNAPEHDLPTDTSLLSIPGFGIQATNIPTGAVGLSFSFDLPVGVAVDATTIPSIGTGNATMLYNFTEGVLWESTIVGPDFVSFQPPPMEDLTFGDEFFANVLFTEPIPNGISFTATWLVPEPQSLTMLTVATLFILLVARGLSDPGLGTRSTSG